MLSVVTIVMERYYVGMTSLSKLLPPLSICNNINQNSLLMKYPLLSDINYNTNTDQSDHASVHVIIIPYSFQKWRPPSLSELTLY